MIYTKEITGKTVALYGEGKTAKEIAEALTLELNENVTERSVIAKLSHLGVYKKKEYLTKRGEVPIKKAEYIDMLAVLLDVNADVLESLEKVNKNVLELITNKLKAYPEVDSEKLEIDE